MNYELAAIIFAGLGVLLVLIYSKSRKKSVRAGAERRSELIATEKAIKQAFLNNRWGNIDDKIEILVERGISIDFRLGVDNERTDI